MKNSGKGKAEKRAFLFSPRECMIILDYCEHLLINKPLPKYWTDDIRDLARSVRKEINRCPQHDKYSEICYGVWACF
jgi:hypothetical protein